MTNWLVTLILKLATSLAIPLLATYLPIATSTQDKLVLGVLTFIVWTVLEILFVLRRLSETSLKDLEIWTVQNAFDQHLSNIRKSFNDIVKGRYGENDLYQDYFLRTVEELHHTITAAAERKELTLTNYHFRSIENVLSAFEGASEKILRELWVLGKDEPLFDAFSRDYFKQIALMAKRQQIAKVKAIFVYSSRADLEIDRFKMLVTFYASWPNFECRLVERSVCLSLMGDERIANDCVDFGIYADRYLFRTLEYGPNEVTRGRFTKDGAEIRRYMRFFEGLWASTNVIASPFQPDKRITVEAVLESEHTRVIIN